MKVIENKTFKYIAPTILKHGEAFSYCLRNLIKIQYAIHDTLFDGSFLGGYSLFIKYYKLGKYSKFLDGIYESPGFIFDYNPTDDLKSLVGCLIIRLPERFFEAYENFIAGAYSKMYSAQEVESMFVSPQVKDVLLHREPALQKFVKDLEETFQVKSLNPKDFEKAEYDFPLILKEEVFNVIEDKPIFMDTDNQDKILKKKEEVLKSFIDPV